MKRRKISSAQRVEMSPPAASPFTKRELVLLSMVVAAGAAVRLLALSRSAVEHFDEGVYASNLYFGSPDYAYPQQRFYAPPLLPALIEAGMIVGLPPNVAALLPGFVAGCTTIVAVWWFGRSWFGPAMGLSAATLVALSDFHVLFSAAALTDVLLGLWLVLAVDAAARSLLTADYRWAVGAGLFTGLAWWTKYNGWLPLAIEGAAIFVLGLTMRGERSKRLAWLVCLAVTCFVAALVWSPYYFSLQPAGGYGPIAANHAKYVVGFSGWFDSAARQISNQYVVERLFSPLSVGVAVALPGLMPGYGAWDRIWRGGACVALILLSFAWSSFVVVGVGAAIGIARMTTALMRNAAHDLSQRAVVGLIFLAVWYGSMLVATPLYTPYARLTLPWLLAAWLAVALNQAEEVADWQLPEISALPAKWQTPLFFLTLASLCLVPAYFFPQDIEPDQTVDRRRMLRIAQQIQAGDRGDVTRAIYVYGEPALYFQLRAAGEDIVAPVQDVPTQMATVDGKAVPTFLIVGPHSQRDAQFQEQWEEGRERFELVKTFEYEPSAMVWLDLHDPRKVGPETGVHAVRLYRFKP